MAKTNRQNIREVRQEEQRAKLSNSSHIKYAVENIVKIEQLEPSETSTFELNKLKIATELRFRLINKYLPDLKAMELTGETVATQPITIEIVNPYAADTAD